MIFKGCKRLAADEEKRQKKAAKKQRQKAAAAAQAKQGAQGEPEPSEFADLKPEANVAPAVAAARVTGPASGKQIAASDRDISAATQAEHSKAQIHTPPSVAAAKHKKATGIPAEPKGAATDAAADALCKDKQQAPAPVQHDKVSGKPPPAADSLGKGKQQALTPDRPIVTSSARDQAELAAGEKKAKADQEKSVQLDSKPGPSHATDQATKTADAVDVPKPKPGKKKAKVVDIKEPSPPPGTPSDNGDIQHQAGTSQQQTVDLAAFQVYSDTQDPHVNGAASFGPSDFADSMAVSSEAPNDTAGWTEGPATRAARLRAEKEAQLANAAAARRELAQMPSLAMSNMRTAVKQAEHSANGLIEQEEEGDVDEMVADGEELEGLAAISNLPPQRRRGNRGGKRHRNRRQPEHAGLHTIQEDTASDDGAADGSPSGAHTARQRHPGTPQTAAHAWPVLGDAPVRTGDDEPDFPPGFPRQPTSTEQWPSLAGAATTAGGLTISCSDN